MNSTGLHAPGAGEDALPFRRYDVETCFGILGVCDGLGASGSRKIVVEGELWSGARIAADLVRKTLAQSFSTFIARVAASSVPVTPDARSALSSSWEIQHPSETVSSKQEIVAHMLSFVATLETDLAEAFREKAREFSGATASSSLRGKALRLLPTTLAAILYHRYKHGAGTLALAIWAGDSRCYAWTPRGLAQLSVDDVKHPVDAMEAMRADAQLAHYLNEAEKPRLNRLLYRWDEPVLLLTASDGFYGFSRTPMHVEHLLLTAGAMSQNEIAFAQQLLQRLGHIAGDDVSLALAGSSWRNWEEVRLIMTERVRELNEKVIMPLNELERALADQEAVIKALTERKLEADQYLEKLRAQRETEENGFWDAFRTHYEQFRNTRSSDSLLNEARYETDD
jgi:serine/threonine protein phosphatase PrpC